MKDDPVWLGSVMGWAVGTVAAVALHLSGVLSDQSSLAQGMVGAGLAVACMAVGYAAGRRRMS